MSYADLALIAVLMFGLYFRAFAEGLYHLVSEMIKANFKLFTLLVKQSHRPLLLLARRLGLVVKKTRSMHTDALERELAQHVQAQERRFVNASSVRGHHRSAEWIYHSHNVID
jgi:hypothetical protein